MATGDKHINNIARYIHHYSNPQRVDHTHAAGESSEGLGGVLNSTYSTHVPLLKHPVVDLASKYVKPAIQQIAGDVLGSDKTIAEPYQTVYHKLPNLQPRVCS
jgi:hypothetical protein